MRTNSVIAGARNKTKPKTRMTIPSISSSPQPGAGVPISWLLAVVVIVSSAAHDRHNAEAPSSSEKDEQVGIELVLVRGGQAVRGARIDLQGGALHELGRAVGRGADGHDLVVVAVDDQRRHVEPLEVLGEVRLRKCLDAVVLTLQPALHAQAPEGVEHALRDRGARPVGAVERHGEVLEVLRAVGGDAGADGVEDPDRHAPGLAGVCSSSGGTASTSTALA